MTRIEKPTRYWGVAILSVLWVLVMVLLNAAGGSPAGNANTALWLVVAYWAFRGNAQSIQTASRYILIIQITVGGAVFIFLLNDPDMHLYFGSPELFLPSIAIPTIAWSVLYWWASSKMAASNAEEGNEKIAILPDRHTSYEETNSKAIAEKIVYPVQLDSTTTPNYGIDFPKALKVIEYSEQAKGLPKKYQLRPYLRRTFLYVVVASLASICVFAVAHIYRYGWAAITYNGQDPWALFFVGAGGAFVPFIVATLIAGIMQLISRSRSSFLEEWLVVFAVATFLFAAPTFYVTANLN